MSFNYFNEWVVPHPFRFSLFIVICNLKISSIKCTVTKMFIFAHIFNIAVLKCKIILFMTSYVFHVNMKIMRKKGFCFISSFCQFSFYQPKFISSNPLSRCILFVRRCSYNQGVVGSKYLDYLKMMHILFEIFLFWHRNTQDYT